MEAVINSLLVVVVWAFGSSFGLEQFELFQDKLSPAAKKFVVAIVTFVAPTLVVWLGPYWKPEFGDVTGFAGLVVSIFAGAAVWVVGQLAHKLDKRF